KEISLDVKAVASKVDRVSDVQSAQQRTLDGQAIVLKDHIARTKLLEDRIEPIEDSYKNAKFFGKLISWIIASGAAVFGAVKFFFHFFIK
ncbi:MAG: hypothetical protein WC895_04710, partial [Candidatus Shapirobacteria bacterium]